ncbi:META domain-containing protein [Actinoplanes sp. NBRC 103695]|uniref:META domain-containing protein n=1 Tax=Actinoplanes sp. NBRC 103695 TaxID=3032202 RepID=UPI0024A48C8C|nr:META domain-containing protein [Actinoplanes sp. NBRC 103695]GLZ02265.1 hypothetical protein Acsp02_95160 [Actinoplanes sp. NBRC 103695]
MKKTRFLIVAASVVVATTISVIGAAGTANAHDARTLPVGQSFVSVALLADDPTNVPPVGAPLRLTFPQPGAIEYTAGCNYFRGTAVIDHNRLNVRDLVSTRRFCEGPSTAVETWFTNLVNESPRWRNSAATITLTSTSAAAGFVRTTP